MHKRVLYAKYLMYFTSSSVLLCIEKYKFLNQVNLTVKYCWFGYKPNLLNNPRFRQDSLPATFYHAVNWARFFFIEVNQINLWYYNQGCCTVVEILVLELKPRPPPLLPLKKIGSFFQCRKCVLWSVGFPHSLCYST